MPISGYHPDLPFIGIGNSVLALDMFFACALSLTENHALQNGKKRSRSDTPYLNTV